MFQCIFLSTFCFTGNNTLFAVMIFEYSLFWILKNGLYIHTVLRFYYTQKKICV